MINYETLSEIKGGNSKIENSIRKTSQNWQIPRKNCHLHTHLTHQGLKFTGLKSKIFVYI